MKANEAPEKIYIQPNARDGWFVTNNLNASLIEYTRTDYAEKEFIIKAKSFLSEIHRVCDITDENGYRIELRDLQARFENFYKETNDWRLGVLHLLAAEAY